jgi:CheY-like chemotaxis protein
MVWAGFDRRQWVGCYRQTKLCSTGDRSNTSGFTATQLISRHNKVLLCEKGLTVTTSNARILVVDDEPSLADTLAIIFQRAGYTATAVYSGEDAFLKFIATNRPSLVVTDVVMPGMAGIEMAKLVRRSYPNCLVLLFSGNADTQDLLKLAEDEGCEFEILAKPVQPLHMLEKVASLLDQNSSFHLWYFVAFSAGK